jgi:hypothetical protein
MLCAEVLNNGEAAGFILGEPPDIQGSKQVDLQRTVAV